MNLDSALIIDRLIDAVYDAIQLPDRWQALAPALRELLGADQCDLLIEFSAPGGPQRIVSTTSTARLSDYLASYRGLGPLSAEIPAKRANGEKCALLSQDFVADGALRASAFYREHWQRWGNLFFACGGRYVLAGAAVIHLELLRAKAHGPFEEVDRQPLNRLIPHILRATQLSARLHETQQRLTYRGNISERLLDAVAVLDADDRVVHSNARYRELVGGVAAEQFWSPRTLRLAGVGEQQRVLDALTQVRRGLSAGTPLRLRRPPPLQPLFVIVAPLQTEAGAPSVAGCVQLFLRDPGWQRRLPDGALENLFALTPGQAKVCAMLLDDHSPEQIAMECGVQVNSVRSQIKQAMEKVGVHRQAELVRHLGQALPALTDL
ncbi:MAG: helix-turn-helix transcriptional regulator [Tahibacter sp.]